jgi:HD-GYP domain-containing protein (c-di-GMP phosphodiesterase class II)
MDPRPLRGSTIRRAEIIAALSLATDLAVGQPMENALRSCVLAMRLGEALGLRHRDLFAVYWSALLRHVGCNAESHSMAALFGDEIELNRKVALTDVGSASEMMPLIFAMLRKANAGARPLAMVAAVVAGLASSKPVAAQAVSGHCEVAERLASRLGFDSEVITAVGQSEERWDGRGLPAGLKGEAIPPAVHVVNLARDFVVLTAALGIEAAEAKLRQRRGGAYDPKIVDVFLKRSRTLTGGFAAIVSWDEVLRLEPEPQVVLADGDIDTACLAMADFADIKSPFTNGHSRAVAALAGQAGRQLGMTSAEVTDLSRAALLHDIGQSAISARIWMKPGPLSEPEWEEVRLHPYYGERILSRSPALARLGTIVGSHHERLDGRGYHRGIGAAGLTLSARVITAAEAYQGMIEERPYRRALNRERAASELKREVGAGRLDADSAEAVLATAGHPAPATRKRLPADLTEREIDVLRHIARGGTMKEVARALGISPKTVDNHIQHIYPKLEVKTRAGAVLFAIEHGIVGPNDGT